MTNDKKKDRKKLRLGKRQIAQVIHKISYNDSFMLLDKNFLLIPYVLSVKSTIKNDYTKYKRNLSESLPISIHQICLPKITGFFKASIKEMMIRLVFPSCIGFIDSKTDNFGDNVLME